MTKSTILSLIQNKFGHIKYSGDTDQISVNCPYCAKRGHTPNTTYKLGINLEKKIYGCFRCYARGSLSILFPQLIVLPDVIAVPVEQEGRGLEALPVCQTLSSLTYPWNKLVYKFLHDKGFDPVSLNRVVFVENYHKNGFSFGPRLMFPIYQHGNYKGFQGRTIYKNTDPKYIGATGMLKGELLYGYDEAFSQRDMLVITEGFFDREKVGRTAVATMGKNITNRQLRLIQLGVFDKVIVFLDKDAEREAYDNAKKISAYFKTYIAHPTKKDPGEMTRTEINEVLTNKLERVY